MFTFSITNHKGGVGKTTTSVNLSGMLAAKGKKVLLVDMDPQANLTSAFGLPEDNSTLYDALMSGKKLDVFEVEPNLFIIPGSLKMADAEVELGNKIAREQKLKKLLSTYGEVFDFVIIDCPPSLSMLTVNSLVASDGILIPLEARYFSTKALDSINRICGEIKDNFNKDLRIVGMFFNSYDPREKLTQGAESQVRHLYNGIVMNSKIRKNIALSECSTPPNNTHIQNYDSNSNGANDYRELTEELLKRI